MTDQNTTIEPGDEYYEETVVEYIDNSRRRTVLGAALALLILLLVGIGFIVLRVNRPAQAPSAEDLPDGVEWIRSIYAYGPTSKQLMNGPVDADVAPDGTIWVSTDRRVLASFSPDGQVKTAFVSEFAGAPGKFLSIEGIAVDENGDVYVAEFGKNAIMVFDENGRYLREWGVQLPQEVDVRDGVVAVAASYGIGLFTTEGELITQWAERGTGDNQVDLPHGIALGDDGNVYVSDTQNHRIKAYTREGRLLWTRTSKSKTGLKSTAETDTIDGVLQNMQIPSSMIFDGAGRLLVVDPFAFQVLVLDTKKKGQIIARYGESGPQDGRFAYPTGIGYDPTRDWFVVADTANNRVQVIRLPGTGGSVLRRSAARFLDQPWWLCLIPLILLILAIMVALSRRRKQRELDAAREQDAA